RWKDIGGEILVTSTINNWIRCTPGTGSLVTLTQGSISCEVVNVVAAASGCTTIAPNRYMDVQGAGPALSVNTGYYYFFDGSTSVHYPTHDPCGMDGLHQLNGVSDPGGALYVR